MKSNQYKEVFNKVDTDINMDHRIKNKLLYYDTKEEQLNSSSNQKAGQTIFLTPMKVGILRTILPSLAVVALVVAVLIGLNKLINNQTGSKEGTSVASNSADEGEVSVEGENASTDTIIDSTTELLETEDVANADTTTESATESITEIDSNAVEDITSSDPVENQDSEAADLIAQIEGDFYFAHFDVVSNGTIKFAIPNLIIRLRGKVNTMDPADVTDIVLTRDGLTIDNPITFTGNYNQFTWGYEDVTDFYFEFEDDNRIPGIYHLSGKYKGNSFEVYDKIIEDAISEQPASENELYQVGWGYHPDEQNRPKEVSELVFYFYGRQNSFYQSDLTELKVTKDGQDISISFRNDVYRYYEYSAAINGGDTSYNLILERPFTESGTYSITGKYRGKEFISMEIVIP